jgi:hypothetical protein
MDGEPKLWKYIVIIVFAASVAAIGLVELQRRYVGKGRPSGAMRAMIRDIHGEVDVKKVTVQRSEKGTPTREAQEIGRLVEGE